MKRYGGWLELASHLHLPLSECLERVTHREYLTWLEWFEYRWNHPDPTEYYLMQIAAEVRRSDLRVKNPKSIRLEHFRLRFGTRRPVRRQVDQKTLLLTKAYWFAATGCNPNKD